MTDATLGRLGRLRRLVGRSPSALMGIVLVSAFFTLALAAPLVAPFDPTAQPAKRLLPPGGRHLLGTDEFGRDVFSRIVHGARISLQVGVVSVGIALALGGTLGLIAGYCLGVVDTLTGRVVDVMFAFPSVILIIAISGVLGAGLSTAMVAIGIVYSPIFARIVRAPTLAVVQQPYVEGARAIGAGLGRVVGRHVLPNIAAPVIVQTTLSFSTAILSEATLSFLGLGTQPPDPSWGTMLSGGRRFMELAPWVTVYPGLAIALTVLGLNLLGDALRDALDPRLGQPDT
ncbi:MAG TPA: ABC transporter permease [Methylomirabilota bacterium]|jgi:peptide/nickel transport system permease protein|nr:ABC transporter permease [Methylomirabilota bacterium]